MRQRSLPKQACLLTLDYIVPVSSVFLKNVIMKLDRFSSEEPFGDALQLWSHVSIYVSKDFASYFLCW